MQSKTFREQQWIILRAIRKTSNGIVSRFLALALCVLMVMPAAVARERGCEGTIYALPAEIENANGDIGFGRGAYDSNAYNLKDHEKIVLIDGKGSCRAGQENKKCRKVAADAALKCARAIWDERWDRSVPADKCGADSNAKIREWAPALSGDSQLSVRGDIKKTIEHQTCCITARNARRVSVVVNYRSTSFHPLTLGGEARRNKRAKEACTRKDIFSSNYEVNCTQLKEEGQLMCPEIPDAKPIPETSEARRNDGAGSSSTSNASKRANPFQIKSAKIDLVKFPKISDTQQCPRKVLIRTTFTTNKAGTVNFKLHRSHKPGEPLNHRAVSKKVGNKWKAVHERVITVKKSINRSFMAESTNKNVKARATGWKKLSIRCNQGHSGSGELDSAS